MVCSDRPGFVNAIKSADSLLGIFLFPWNWFIHNVIRCLFKCYPGSRLTGIHSLFRQIVDFLLLFRMFWLRSNTFRHIQTTYKHHSDERADRAAC